MNAFAGIFRRDGAPVAGSGLGSAEAALLRRGLLYWHRRFDWAVGASLPIDGRDDASPIAVAADARLDNRAELVAELGLSRSLLDPAIIAAAYRRWGEDCPERLEGEFAFILYDRRRDILFCARDHFGVRPFYYHLDDRLFAAATITSFLTAIPAIGDEPDEAGIADLIAGGYADHSVTIHRGICRLPPGHALTVTRTSSRITGFWKPSDVSVAEHRNAPETFRTLFRDAVGRRLVEPSTGVMLSGGLDSSAVALEAAGIRPMRSLSLTLDRTPGWNERPHIEAILETGRFEPDFISGDDDDPLAELPALLDEQEGPFVAYNVSLSRRIYARAATAGIAVLLDGHGGDEIVSHGLGRLNELATDGQWRDLWRESAGIAGIYGVSPWQIMSPYLSHIAGVRVVRRRWDEARTRLGWSGEAPASSDDLVAPELAARVNLSDRQDRSPVRRSARHSERDLHIEALSAPQQAYGFEILDRMSAAAGVRSRYPFYDLKLAKFCLSLPSREKLADGLPRRVLREAMKGIMPETVRLRLDKYNFAPALADALLRRQQLVCNLVRGDRGGVSAYVDMDIAKAALDRLLDKGRGVDGGSLFAVWRTIMLALWLERRGQGRVWPAQRQGVAA
ncbi:asparagine synthase-related protein [Sphingomonas sp. SRS2]|uniref:asparagine synthase-related protein n=1 Tax=Sphingomonas sp. SRS2 TaxID=133190 RepID=UPI0006184AF8|nr:asparagine synthase-related protein [Sphingomonas sp. SRS2]KKC27756.1 hypothetical protein WP12_00780 [Sphingomonas sp. SRS2]